MALPTEKSTPSRHLGDYVLWLYGEPKVGKTTWASWFPDTLFILPSPAPEALSLYQVSVSNWEESLRVFRDLRDEDHGFRTIVIDPVELLFSYCQDYVRKLHGFKHEGDLGHGKGWHLVSDEFLRVMGRVCSLGMGVIFVSHADLKQIETPEGKRHKYQPAVGASAFRVLNQLTAFILFLQVEATDEGDRRILRTRPGPLWNAGVRTPEGKFMPDIVLEGTPDDYDKFTAAFEKLFEEEDNK